LNFQHRSELLQQPVESAAARLLPRQEEHLQAEAVCKGSKRLPRLLLVRMELPAVLPVIGNSVGVAH
jgi:hypothetical protein